VKKNCSAVDDSDSQAETHKESGYSTHGVIPRSIYAA
jgi:hypothetical protein